MPCLSSRYFWWEEDRWGRVLFRYFGFSYEPLHVAVLNVGAQWVAAPVRIRVVPCSDLGPVSVSLTDAFSGFPHPLKEMLE
jgi:hypothetical protein